MKYDHDIKWVRQVLKTADIMNTLNGGTSQPRTKLRKTNNSYVLNVQIPGVDADTLKVDIIDKSLFVYHNLMFGERSDAVVMVPHVVATYPLSPDIDFRSITATYEDKTLRVVMPFNELRSGFYRGINIQK
ncbi:hypothetical protein C900_01373 [Fulvivirga imtechensis AK7]|uniref:SHSP domain-containing protein n=1 Tax=Fulvivirga imtechensis AK7 TaxID=1237149 RepID=L8K054_9BACT|nr:Hsp20/alpha crystallin family protein [Fulvivirga imtechensis]ELR73763.1 hypothetical protein C900_01373 [Fulvivirga imtechensis AK7]